MVLKRLLIAQAIALVFFSAVLPVEIVYVKETLHAGDSGYGLLLASWGTGMVIGSVAFAILRGARLGFLLLVSTLVIGIAYLGMGAAPTLWAACAMAALGGTGNGVQWVSVISAVQELTAESMQARVISVLEASASATPGLGFVVGGLIAGQLRSAGDLSRRRSRRTCRRRRPRRSSCGLGMGGTHPQPVRQPLDSDDEVMVELRPRGGARQHGFGEAGSCAGEREHQKRNRDDREVVS